MSRRDWTRDELILAMNLYCQLPFGRLHKGNPEIIRLAEALDRTPSSVSMKLCNFASLDPVHQRRGVKGLSGASAGDRQVWSEFHADWDRLAAESEGLREKLDETTSEPDASRMELSEDTFIGATDSTAVVRIRRAQRFFRKSVLASYNSCCCITEIAIPQLLIASHILPWSKFPNHRANPRNGLCLSRIHDAAFDQGFITFDDHFRLVLSRELRDATTNEVLRTSFRVFEGKPIHFPEKFLPDPEFVSSHRTNVFRG